MELFELKESIAEVQADVDYYQNEYDRLFDKTQPKSADPSKEIIRGGKHDKESALIELTQMGINLEEAIAKLNNLTKLRDKKYNIYKEHNDYDKQIYMEKKLLKWSNVKISTKHNGLSKSQIYRIIKKIEKK